LVPGFLFAVGAASFDPARLAMPPLSPRTLPPKGHVLFQDDFSSDSLSGWEADRAGVWTVRNGALRADLPDRRQERSFLFAGSDGWTNYAVDLDVCAMRGVDKGVAVRVADKKTGVGIDLRGPGYQDVIVNVREWSLGKARVVNANGAWHHIRVEVRDQSLRVWVNGTLLIDRPDAKRSPHAGRIALAAYTGGVGECTVFYDNVVVTELP
ncbi:MAG: DUF1080 domain-containing protein, partial [Candidatus Eisenbacteria bacterium]|nr:DUF1080 domain-containing protein [Candidatus Eisenbacteria bacterium]